MGVEINNDKVYELLQEYVDAEDGDKCEVILDLLRVKMPNIRGYSSSNDTKNRHTWIAVGFLAGINYHDDLTALVRTALIMKIKCVECEDYLEQDVTVEDHYNEFHPGAIPEMVE